MKKCVLICDDDVDILEVCKFILEKKNFQVKTCTSYDSVFSDMKEINPDIILMDLWMPGMGGEEATIKIKSNPDTKHIPVILFSANNELEQIANKVHANGFIRKPFELKELQNILAEHCL